MEERYTGGNEEERRDLQIEYTPGAGEEERRGVCTEV